MSRSFTPMENFGGKDTAGDEEDDDDGQGPAFARKGIGNIDDMLGEDSEKKDIEDAQQVDGVESGSDGQSDAEPSVIF